MKLKVGEKIPKFQLSNHNKEKITLGKFDGENVLLSFHPAAWTSVCRDQMQSLEDNYQEFEKNNTIPLGISVDPVPSKRAWAEDMGLDNLDLLSDFWPHGDFASKLGIFNEDKGVSGRVNILVDAEGKILWAKEYDPSKLPDIDEVLEAVADNA